MATAFLLALHWDQAKALLAPGAEGPRLRPERKRRPLSRRYRTGLLAAVTGLVAIPYLEELWRCARVSLRAEEDASGGSEIDQRMEARA